MKPDPPAVWSQAPIPAAAQALVRAGHPDWLARLLARRGVDTAERAAAFLEPSLDQLHDPARLAGLAEAVERLNASRRDGERVAVVGDYDVDGVSATAQLAAVFRACRLECSPILPRRLEEGYGFQPLHVEQAREAGCSVVVTADCGATSAEAVAAAHDAGLDVIVTDHHLPDPGGLAGAVVVNPRQEACDYPFPDLSGAGLAFKLASAFAERCGRPVDPLRLLRVACLGTICDLVPLVGENRVIAALGLAELPRTPSAGLQALMSRASVRPPLTAADVGFRLGPRLNAAGRMEAADPALELLLTTDRQRAGAIAERLEVLNRTRRAEETGVVEAALEQVRRRPALPPIVVAWSADWHPGVVGIAAGRVARQLHRPTVLLSLDGDSATGSGRSVEGIHLHAFLGRWRGRLERFGGHSQAIGLTAATRDLDRLRGEWEEAAAAAWDSELLEPRLGYEERLEPAAVDGELLARLERLEPFGVGNPQPLFRIGPLRASAPPRRFGSHHAAWVARGPGGARLDLVGWRWAEREDELEGEVEVLAAIERDRYLDRPSLRLVAARPAAGASVQSRT